LRQSILAWSLVAAAVGVGVYASLMVSGPYAGVGVTLVLSRVVANVASWILGAAVGIAFANRKVSLATFILTLGVSLLLLLMGYINAIG